MYNCVYVDINYLLFHIIHNNNLLQLNVTQIFGIDQALRAEVVCGGAVSTKRTSPSGCFLHSEGVDLFVETTFTNQTYTA